MLSPHARTADRAKAECLLMAFSYKVTEVLTMRSDRKGRPLSVASAGPEAPDFVLGESDR